MRDFTVSFLVALSLLLPAVHVAAQTPLPVPLANPGFEGAYAPLAECANITGAVANGWSDNTCWDTARPVIQYAREAAGVHGGASAQKVTLVSGNRVQFAQFLSAPVTTGKRYTVSFWLRAQAPLFVTAALRQGSAPYAGYTNKLVKASAAWTRFEFDGLTQNSDAVLLIIAETPGTFWIDDVSVTSTPSTAANPSPAATPVTRSYFGMHFNRLDTPWPQVGTAIGAVRIWDAGDNRNGTGTGAQWSEINAVVGVYDWSGLDARVAAATARNADIVYTLGGRTPRWAAAQPNANSPYGLGQCSEPASDAIWQEWVRTIATRYKGRIKYWEVWNEPDIRDFYCGTPDKLIDLARQAHAVIKQVDPSNQVLSPGFSGYQGPGYLDYYLAQGGAQYADIVPYHFYVERPEDSIAYTANLRATIQRQGLQGKPLWNTEQGWIEIPLVNRLPQATGAAYLARAYLLHWAYGISRYYYYTWDNQWNRFEFVQADGTTLTQAGQAYREVAQWMTGKVMESLSIDASGNYIVTLRDASAKRSWALWNPNQTLQFALPATWGATRQRELTGAAVDLNARTSVAVGATPILLEQAQSTATALTLDKSSAASGTAVTATWSGIASPTSTDWIGLHRPGTPSQSFIDWLYVTCSKAPGAARASGSCGFTIPATLAAGTYELRLHSANGFTVIAASPALTVTGTTAGAATLGVSPASVTRGASVSATWSGIAKPTPTDWIGLHRPGAASQSFIDWIYVSCSKSAGAARASGICSFPIPATLAAGAYELRLHSANGFTVIAPSAALTVSAP